MTGFTATYRLPCPPSLLVDPASGGFQGCGPAKVGGYPQTASHVGAQAQDGAALGQEAGLAAGGPAGGPGHVPGVGGGAVDGVGTAVGLREILILLFKSFRAESGFVLVVS